jgi:GNAT acetyltransferase-like protein
VAETLIRRYEPALRNTWDSFVDRAKNATFLFRRDYMEYHADRFADASLLFERAGKLAAVIPANRREGDFASHGGLTYGGIVCDDRMSTEGMLAIFEALLEHLRASGVERLIYKPVPHIYHAYPAEEDLYALFRAGARLARRDVGSSIEVASRYALAKGRRWAVKKSERSEIDVAESWSFEAFMELEARLLEEKYGAAPVHSGAEMRQLADRFPENIRLFTAQRNGELLGGTIIYETPRVAHAQYIASTDVGREVGALDRLFAWLLDDVYAGKRYFDFGISTEQEGRVLNHGLIENKESWGARATVYDHYELRL